MPTFQHHQKRHQRRSPSHPPPRHQRRSPSNPPSSYRASNIGGSTSSTKPANISSPSTSSSTGSPIPVSVPAKARPTSRPSWTRSEWIPGSFHNCQLGQWHPPVQIWDYPFANLLIGKRIGHMLSEDEDTREAEEQSECDCPFAAIECSRCHLNCCVSCRFRQWKLCKLCAYKRMHPTRDRTLDQFLWHSRCDDFLKEMKQHT